MKKLFCYLILAAMTCACNIDSTTQLAGSDSETKAQNPSDAWQKTIEQGTPVIKQRFIEFLTAHANEPFIAENIDLSQAEAFEVKGIPIYNIAFEDFGKMMDEDAVWRTMKVDPKQAVFFLMHQGRVVFSSTATYENGAWKDINGLGFSPDAQFRPLSEALAQGKSLMKLNVAYNAVGQSYGLIAVQQNGVWYDIHDTQTTLAASVLAKKTQFAAK
ncbi:MAG: hypothetical protein J6X20_06115 [Bacteroidales bacterium]|nr:hypothetical protein [Bacteroidales bacterium]